MTHYIKYQHLKISVIYIFCPPTGDIGGLVVHVRMTKLNVPLWLLFVPCREMSLT